MSDKPEVMFSVTIPEGGDIVEAFSELLNPARRRDTAGTGRYGRAQIRPGGTTGQNGCSGRRATQRTCLARTYSYGAAGRDKLPPGRCV